MVKTGARARELARLLAGAGYRLGVSPPAPRIESLSPELAIQVWSLYESLGGATGVDRPRPRPGAWDLAFENGLVVELDEELHFNRYRQLTLEASWASVLPWRDQYLRYCAKREAECLAAGKWGARWTNPSCEAMFGTADAPGEFGDSGATRWKQRALYDSLKDATAVARPDLRLARLATHDRVGDVELGVALEHRAELDVSELALLLEQRTLSAPS